MIGYPELIVILALVLILFGANKLPEIARSLGKSTKEFKKAQMETENELKNESKNLEQPIENRDTKIYRLAIEMGIDTKNKTTKQLTEEIFAKVRLQADK